MKNVKRDLQHFFLSDRMLHLIVTHAKPRSILWKYVTPWGEWLLHLSLLYTITFNNFLRLNKVSKIVLAYRWQKKNHTDIGYVMPCACVPTLKILTHVFVPWSITIQNFRHLFMYNIYFFSACLFINPCAYMCIISINNLYK